jgi:hypothetical protein
VHFTGHFPVKCTRSETDPPAACTSPGFDTKFAMHALRLGVQGVELLETGRITLPVSGESGDYLRAVRRGDVEKAEVIDAIGQVENRLVELARNASLPPQPDRKWVDDWLHRSYLVYWQRLGA